MIEIYVIQQYSFSKIKITKHHHRFHIPIFLSYEISSPRIVGHKYIGGNKAESEHALG